jgi:predicted PurR-regulated permease PerM
MPQDILTERQRRLLDAILILGVVALAFIVVGFASSAFYAFGDIVLLFFLAWLLSFALLPLINFVARIPRVPPPAAVIIVYLTMVVLLLGIIVQASATIYASISQFLNTAPEFETQLRILLGDIESRLAAFGLAVNLVDQAPTIVANLREWAGQLTGPLQSLAVASIGVFGNVLLLVILSIYIAVDREDILAFLYRLVPPSLVPQARLLQVAVGRSFGGFLRGQLIMGLVFGAFTALVNILFGLQYAALTTVASGLLHLIPFFGPFVSWAPPVIAAALTPDGPVLPVLILMGIGWFVTMNILQPRLMSGSVGIHPIVVLASVIIGSKIAGIAGAIFGIPIAAVISAFFFHWVARSRETGTVADRATRRVAAREGRIIRRPREPVPGVDADVVDDADAPTGAAGSAPAPAGPSPAPGPASVQPSAAGATPGKPAHAPVALPEAGPHPSAAAPRSASAQQPVEEPGT